MAMHLQQMKKVREDQVGQGTSVRIIWMAIPCADEMPDCSKSSPQHALERHWKLVPKAGRRERPQVVLCCYDHAFEALEDPEI